MTQPTMAYEHPDLGRLYADPWTGRNLPSITNVQGVKNKPFLPPWYSKLAARCALDNLEALADMVADGKDRQALNYVKGAGEREMDAASTRGDDVHAYLEARLTGAEAPDVCPAAAKHLKAVEDWLDWHKPEPLWVEHTVISDAHAYAGTFDLIARFPRLGETLLVDLKTSKRIYGTTALQLVACRRADWLVTDPAAPSRIPMPAVDRCAVLRTHTRGWQFREVRAGDREWIAFRAARNLWDWGAVDEGQVVGGDDLLGSDPADA